MNEMISTMNVRYTLLFGLAGDSDVSADEDTLMPISFVSPETG